MAGWRLFWALVGLCGLHRHSHLSFISTSRSKTLFTLVINGLGYDNAMFWVMLIAGIVGFCAYHWRAYRLYIVQRRSVDGMVLASLRGSAFIAILFCAGAAAQSMLILLRLSAAGRLHARRRVRRAAGRRRRHGDPHRDLLPDLLAAQGGAAESSASSASADTGSYKLQ